MTKYSMGPTIFLFCLFLTLFLTYFLIVNTEFGEVSSLYFGSNVTKKEFSLSTDSTEDGQICHLPILQPWDTSIRKYLNPTYNPNAGCIPEFQHRSYIVNGLLWINGTKELNEICLYQCTYGLSDFVIKFDDWILIDKVNGAKPECDVIEVRCSVNGTSTYKFLHAQIFEKPLKGPKLQKNAYNVHIIVIDAVSMSHFQRALPQTLHYLQSQLDAIAFSYLNKVGQNSRPNSYAFLLGLQPEQLSKNSHDLTNQADVLCDKPLNNDTIFTDFQTNGYRTMFFEDWASGVFNWPNCKGFTTNKLDHFMRPFALRYWTMDEYKDEDLEANLFKKSCIEHHKYAFELIGKYMGSYKRQPKFSLSWLSMIAHDYVSDLFHADKHFRAFFKSNKNKISNSFVFFMSDHGNNMDEIAGSQLGLIEKKNPFLVVIPPEELRKNADFMNQLNVNSKQLITHYDLYATFLEIATNSHEWNEDTKFSTFDFKPTDREIIGSSLLHPLKQPRNCKSLKIPFDYCLCEEDSKTIKNEKITVEIAELAVKKMNEAVTDSEFHDKCAQLTVNETETINLTLKEFSPRNGKQLYRAELRVSPSGGYYEALAVIENGKLSLVSQKFPRLDRYAEQTKCIPEHFIRNYCYCKDLLTQ